MKKILIALCCAFVLFVLGLLLDNPLIASCCVVPLIVVALTFMKQPQKKGGTNIPPLKHEAPLPKQKKQLHHTFISGVQYYDADKLIRDIDFDEFGTNSDYFMSRKELIEEDNHEKIWLYDPVDLDAIIEAEPTNEHDSNALKIIAMYEEKQYFLGYVPKEKQEDVKGAERYYVTVNGGQYKQLTDDDELIKDTSKHSFNFEWIK